MAENHEINVLDKNKSIPELEQAEFASFKVNPTWGIFVEHKNDGTLFARRASPTHFLKFVMRKEGVTKKIAKTHKPCRKKKFSKNPNICRSGTCPKGQICNSYSMKLEDGTYFGCLCEEATK